MKHFVIDNLKNLTGWRTDEKLVVLAVDDYGSVRLDSVAAQSSLEAAGLRLNSRFDRFDAMETRADLEALFDVLLSVKDASGNPAVVTAFTLCANPDFEDILSNRNEYCYERLPQTFDRLAARHPIAYSGAWQLWREGIEQRIWVPQFHGREHFNVELFNRKLQADDPAMNVNLENRSMAALGDEPSMPGVGFTHAFGTWKRDEVEGHREILEDGLSLFSSTFGIESKTFTPPAQRIHQDLYATIDDLGVRGVFKPRWCQRRIHEQKQTVEVNLRERSANHQHLSLVRNVAFEPTANGSSDPVKPALRQISAAFRWNRPAMISSHRVNFGGHIDERNRRLGLSSLQTLLKEIVCRWPDAQFISAESLVDRILVNGVER